MTCFWDGISRSLDHNDYKILGITKLGNHIENIKQIINACKRLSKQHSVEIKWQNKLLTQKEKEEITEAIEDYDINGICHGHFTSICDPFMCFLSSILHHRMVFQYMQNRIVFEPETPIKEVFYRANSGHFVFQSMKIIDNTNMRMTGNEQNHQPVVQMSINVNNNMQSVRRTNFLM